MFLGLSILQLISVFGINCYECQKDDFLCSPGLLGKKVPCKADVTHCIKTWTGKLMALVHINMEVKSYIKTFRYTIMA